MSEMTLRTPCNRMCDVEWCSLFCFARRGYMYDTANHEWFKGTDGKPLRREERLCDYEPKDVDDSTRINTEGEL